MAGISKKMGTREKKWGMKKKKRVRYFKRGTGGKKKYWEKKKSLGERRKTKNLGVGCDTKEEKKHGYRRGSPEGLLVRKRNEKQKKTSKLCFFQ